MTTFNGSHDTIKCHCVFHLHGGSEPMPVQVQLTWDPTDPCAVQALFRRSSLPGRDDVVWVLSRDVLAAGLLGPAGFGDVTVYPTGDQVRFVLDSPSGHATFDTDADDLEYFLTATFAVAPGGSEYSEADLDALLSELLGQESS